MYRQFTHDIKAIEGVVDANFVKSVDTINFVLGYIFTLFKTETY